MITKVATTDLKIGMFVADLDRPWGDTPFLLQGFLVDSDKQILELRRYCRFVIVDRARSTGKEYAAPAAVDVKAAARSPMNRAAVATQVRPAATTTVAPPQPVQVSPPKRVVLGTAAAPAQAGRGECAGATALRRR
jgi:hypothetical protein